MNEIRRMWINQPSTLQPLHALHGRRVLAVIEREQYPQVLVYFTEGPELSRTVPPLALSDGWPGEETRP